MPVGGMKCCVPCYTYAISANYVDGRVRIDIELYICILLNYLLRA